VSDFDAALLPSDTIASATPVPTGQAGRAMGKNVSGGAAGVVLSTPVDDEFPPGLNAIDIATRPATIAERQPSAHGRCYQVPATVSSRVELAGRRASMTRRPGGSWHWIGQLLNPTGGTALRRLAQPSRGS
jgi:hypothetical protein